ncbi:MAG: coproporphyrinogen dehydrogenase HemZ [Lachnospiraceae bacterium]
MIQIVCKSEAYTYNVYHIVKAFFPSEEIINRVEEKASHYVMVQLPKQGRIVIGRDAGEEADRQLLAGKRRKLKYQIDISLYHELERITGRTLAWGILTGVRPTKIAMEKAKAGWSREQFVPWFQQDCLVSAKKAELAWEIAKREQALLSNVDYEEGYSLYVGIPFCPTVCTYCSFSSGAIADWADRVEDYLDALTKELAFVGDRYAGKKLNSIYIGGGTPTTLTASQLERLLGCIDTHFSREYLLEYTVEAGRPDSIDQSKLEVLRRYHITRLSINPQSMQQKTLDAIGRKHGVEEIVEAFCLARKMGFSNINMDLIAGLPGEELHDMEDTLGQIGKLAPDSLTVHALAIKRAAQMEWADLERDTGEMSGMLSDMIEAAADAAAQMGLIPYYLYRQKNIAGNFENVGYAKADKMGIYNILMMEEVQTIVACGAGSVSKRVYPDGHIERCENVKDVAFFLERIDEMIERKRKLLED